MYANGKRDLVDTMKEDREILTKVKIEELPDVLQKLPPEERSAYVQNMAARRAEIQKQINALAAERDAYIAKEQRRQSTASGTASLGDAVVTAIQSQLTQNGFEVVAAVAE
jgi:hypothetical protein